MGYMASQNDTSPATIKKGLVYGAALASATVQGFGVETLYAQTAQTLDDAFHTLRGLVAI